MINIVVDAIDKSYGMFPSTLGNVGVIEIDQIKNLMVKAVESVVREIVNSSFPLSVSFDVSKISEINDFFNPVVHIVFYIYIFFKKKNIIIKNKYNHIFKLITINDNNK